MQDASALLAAFLLILSPVRTQAASPEVVFAKASKSIVTVLASGPTGRALGSGVVIRPHEVVTNCHVVDNATSGYVRYQNKRYPIYLRYADVQRDLCQLNVPGLSAPAVPIVKSAQLKVGQMVYAIGTPKGLDLTLSNGLISSLRHTHNGNTVIQTSAPISEGSSGGGLFDSEGRLIGVTTYYVDGGQNLNFALPADWISELPKRGNTALARQSQERYRATARNVMREITEPDFNDPGRQRSYYDRYTYER